MDLEISNQLAAGLSQIALFLRQVQWREAETLGLTPTQILALTMLKRRGPQRIQQIAKLLGVTQPTASDAITALTAKHLVRKHADPRNGRAVLVEPTRRGSAILASGEDPPRALLAALDRLGGDELAAFQRVLVKLIRQLQVSGAIEPQRLCVTCRHFRPFAHKDAAAPHHCAFVDAAIGDASLRVDCGDHDEADDAEQAEIWALFASASAAE